MKQELFETISRITGHDCVDSELNEIINNVKSITGIRKQQHEATKEAVYALYCDCSGEINEEDLNILEMPEIE